MAAALAGALISGVGMYAIGTHAQDRFATAPATVPSYYVAAPQPVGTLGYTAQPSAMPAGYYQPAPQAFATPVAQRTAVPQRTVYREVAPAPVTRRVVEPRHRSIAKTAMIIGGSTAGAAGVGGLLGGKKGALIGAALGGGAASIYEATRR